MLQTVLSAHLQAGISKLFKQFSFPGGIPSHCSPDTPGSMHEGGELGYSLSHAFGAVLDKPNLIAACVVGDGEAEVSACAAFLALLYFPKLM
jgi:xylulose-5-phosphate/fructose-6-phosphate phosphoketolase